MKTEHFENIMRNLPIIIPVFKIIRIPEWAERYELKKGEEVFINRYGSAVGMQDYSRYKIGPSYLEFVEYRQVNDDKIKRMA